MVHLCDLKATVPLWGSTLFLLAKFRGVPDTRLIYPEKMIGWLEHGATKWFGTQNPVFVM